MNIDRIQPAVWNSRAVVHGNLVDGMQLPDHAEILMTADFGNFEAPCWPNTARAPAG